MPMVVVNLCQSEWYGRAGRKKVLVDILFFLPASRTIRSVTSSGIKPIQLAQMQQMAQMAMAAFASTAEEDSAPEQPHAEERYYGVIRELRLHRV